MTALLHTVGLDIAVAGRVLVHRLELALQRGYLIAMLGPNGVGKTLTLHTLAGIRAARSGAIRLNGSELRKLGHRDRALGLGLLLQDQEDTFPTTVLEVALMGRHARLGLWQWETEEDQEIACRALAEVDLAGTGERLSMTLSGGERRRLGIATLLVQDPELFLLDEPLNHLDPRHQFAVLDKLRDLAGRGKTIVASLHDPALAARYFDFALLLYGDGRWRFSPTDDLLDTQILSDLYEVSFERYRPETGAGHELIALPASTRAGFVPPAREQRAAGDSSANLR